MVNAEDLPGGLKARAVLKQMEINPPKKNRARRGGIVRQYVEALYAELRSAREKGWTWKAILAELAKIDSFPVLSKSSIPKVFAEVDLEWEKKTGQKALAVKRYKRKTRKSRAIAQEAA